jgi:hypothetical protein
MVRRESAAAPKRGISWTAARKRVTGITSPKYDLSARNAGLSAYRPVTGSIFPLREVGADALG